MPVNKSMLERLIILDKALRKKTPRYTTDMLHNKVMEELGFEVSSKTINNDLLFLRKYIPAMGDSHPWNYPSSDISIWKILIGSDDKTEFNNIMHVYQAYLVSQEFSFMPAMQEVWKEFDVLDEVFSEVGFPVNRLIQLDFNRKTKGLAFIPIILEAIANRQKLWIKYQSYKDAELVKFDIEPYFVKEYNNRWYLIGYDTDKYYKVVNVALDRIQDLAEARETFDPKPIDITTYFEDTIGVTKMEEVPVQEVRFWAETVQAKYIASKPLHPSQQVLQTDADGVVFSIEVRPNRELIQNLLHFGKGVKVLSPDTVIEAIREQINGMYAVYQA